MSEGEGIDSDEEGKDDKKSESEVEPQQEKKGDLFKPFNNQVSDDSDDELFVSKKKEEGDDDEES